MKVTLYETPFEGLVIVQVPVYEDERGFFMESWNRQDLATAGLDVDFVQDNHSLSGANVLRGLHYQDSTEPVAKLVRCTRGSVFDVAVDLRARSRTFGQWFGIELSEKNRKQLYIPVGFAHGFLCLTETAELQYKQTGNYSPAAEHVIRWNDAEIGIEWPVSDPLLSARDRDTAISFEDYRKHPAFE